MPIELTLSYGKEPVRVLLDHDGLWFAARDLYAIHRLKTDRAILARIDPGHLRLLSFSSDTGPIRLTAVSSLGALTVAKWLPSKLARILDAWVRREAGRLAEEHGFAPLGMKLLADGTLPTKPRAADDLYLPWKEMELRCWGLQRRQANYDEPALADEDTNALFDRRAESAAFIASLLAAGEAAQVSEAVTKT